MTILYLINPIQEKIFFIEDYEKYTVEQINQLDFINHYAVSSDELTFEELHLMAINQIENILIKDLAILNNYLELENDIIKIIKPVEYIDFKTKMKNFLIEEWEFEQIIFN